MIKNINVVFKADDENNPKGLNNVDLDQLSSITNNYVEHIDCVELDKFTITDRHKLFVTAIKFLKLK